LSKDTPSNFDNFAILRFCDFAILRSPLRHLAPTPFFVGWVLLLLKKETGIATKIDSALLWKNSTPVCSSANY
jgi:hypothetical protein